MIKAILWDNDGILVDTEKYYYEATKEILSRYNVNLTKELYIENLLIKSQGAWHLIQDKALSESDIKMIRDERNSIYCSLIEKADVLLLDGVAETLQRLSGNYKMAVVTSSRKAHFNLIHSKTNILKFFDFTLTREDYNESKPNPEPYLLAVKKMGVDKKECIVIEDSERGLIAAHAAGLDCWVIPNELTKGLNFSLASRVLNSISEIEDELKSMLI